MAGRRTRRTAVSLVAAALGVASIAAAQAPAPTPSAAAGFVPPAPTRHFTDQAAFVPPAAAGRLDEKLARFAAETGHRFLVVVFKEMPVLEPPAASMQDFTLRTANIWGVGRKGFDDGVVLFVFVKERKLRLEVGHGLGAVLNNDVSQRIVDEMITPAFRRGETTDGLEAGIDAVIAVLQTKPTPRPSPASPSPAS